MEVGDKKGEKKISRKKKDSDDEDKKQKKPNTKPSKKRGTSSESDTKVMTYSESDKEGKRGKNKKEAKSEPLEKKEKSTKEKKEKPKKATKDRSESDEDTSKSCKPQKRNKMVLDEVHDSDKEIKDTEELSRPGDGEKGMTKKQPEKKKKKEESEEEDTAPKKAPAKKKQEESETDSDSEKKKKLKKVEKKTTEKLEEPDKKTKDKQANKKKNSSESSESEDLKSTKKERDKTVKQGKKKVKIFNSDTDPEEEKDQPTAIRQSTIQDLQTSTRNALFPTDKSEYVSFRSMILIDELINKTIMIQTKLFTIGRDEKSSYRVIHDKVSANQCEILSNDNLALLFDKNSTNGTFLQLRPGNAYQIRKNMVVEMGRSLFLFKREKKLKKFVLQGSAGRMNGKTIREFKKGEENFKFLVLGKQKEKDKNEYLCIEDEGIEDEHGLILNIGTNFFIMPLESEKG